MKLPTWSLAALLGLVLACAASLAALRHPTDEVAFAAGVGLAFGLMLAIAVAVGARGIRRSSCTAFALVCTLVLYMNDPNRKTLAVLPAFDRSAAEWLNERFEWAEWTGPPKTFVYWSSEGLVRFVSFDAQGKRRSTGSLTKRQAEQSLRGAIDLNNLPTEFPLPRPNLTALQDIVSLATALLAGTLAGFLAPAGGKP